MYLRTERFSLVKGTSEYSLSLSLSLSTFLFFSPYEHVGSVVSTESMFQSKLSRRLLFDGRGKLVGVARGNSLSHGEICVSVELRV